MLEGVSVDPGCTMLPVSPQFSLRVESLFPRGPWNVAVEHECQNSVSPRSPRNTPFVNPVEGWWFRMDVVHPRCAGIDCSKKDAKVCVRIQGTGGKRASSTVRTWGATTSQILALREHLLAEQVTCVVIESTSDYWKPFYYLLDDALNMMLVNASRVRNVPGRKTDLLTELSDPSRRECVRRRARLVRFAAREQRCGCAEGVVRAGGAA